MSNGFSITVTGNNLLTSCNAHALSLTVADVELNSNNLPLIVTSGGSITPITLNSPPVNLRDTVLCVSTTATDELPTSSLTIFPNPTSGTFSIRGMQPNAESELRIFDMVGKEVYHAPVTNTDDLITLALENGIYFVQFDTGKEKIVRKVVVR